MIWVCLFGSLLMECLIIDPEPCSVIIYQKGFLYLGWKLGMLILWLLLTLIYLVIFPFFKSFSPVGVSSARNFLYFSTMLWCLWFADVCALCHWFQEVARETGRAGRVVVASFHPGRQVQRPCLALCIGSQLEQIAKLWAIILLILET